MIHIMIYSIVLVNNIIVSIYMSGYYINNEGRSQMKIMSDTQDYVVCVLNNEWGDYALYIQHKKTFFVWYIHSFQVKAGIYGNEPTNLSTMMHNQIYDNIDIIIPDDIINKLDIMYISINVTGDPPKTIKMVPLNDPSTSVYNMQLMAQQMNTLKSEILHDVTKIISTICPDGIDNYDITIQRLIDHNIAIYDVEYIKNELKRLQHNVSPATIRDVIEQMIPNNKLEQLCNIICPDGIDNNIIQKLKNEIDELKYNTRQDVLYEHIENIKDEVKIMRSIICPDGIDNDTIQKLKNEIDELKCIVSPEVLHNIIESKIPNEHIENIKDEVKIMRSIICPDGLNIKINKAMDYKLQEQYNSLLSHLYIIYFILIGLILWIMSR